MNRIYQGRVTKMESVGDETGGRGAIAESPSLGNWGEVLWNHHVLYQDAVNYYSLCLAALAGGLEPSTEAAKAATGWRDQVRDTWKRAKRKAVEFPGPHDRIAPILGLHASSTDFDDCAQRVLRNAKATPAARAAALLQLLAEANSGDLNQMCVSRLPWFCTPRGMLDATPKSVVAQQEAKMLEQIRAVHAAGAEGLEAVANELEPGYFVTQFPKERLSGAEARAEAVRLFDGLAKKNPAVKGLRERFTQRLAEIGEQLALPSLGRKPKGTYPLAVLFKLLPIPETWEIFKAATAGAAKRSAPDVQADLIADARVEDYPLFDYFTNLAMVRPQDSPDRAVWFEFDLAAFIDAIKAPHRYFEDTQERAKGAAGIQERIAAMERRGGKAGGSEGEEEDDSETFGFEGDERIRLLRESVLPELVEELDRRPSSEDIAEQYSIQERTLRGYEDLRKAWRALAARSEATKENLRKVLAEHQAKHREDFGSSRLFLELIEPVNHPIWRDPGTEPWHASDPLRAWNRYAELKRELADKKRPIRFTPAEPTRSPRFFILPKQGRFGTDHLAGSLAFTCGIAIRQADGWRPVSVRIVYSAPRLCRDELRHPGDTDLEAATWLQPMMKALGLPDPNPTDFANCRVTLQPASAANVQLTFPVEVPTEQLIAALGKQAAWNRQFNTFPDGGTFRETSLRWPHEKQPSKGPVPWWETVDRFRVLAVDLGQRDAGAFALLEASAKSDFGAKPSRRLGETPGKPWRAAVAATGLLRLPGEDRREWRTASKREASGGGQAAAWRQELYGEKGRLPTLEETEEAAALLARFGVAEDELLPTGWRQRLSFPEQNDVLLLAARRAQSRVSRLHRWCWFLTDPKHQNKVNDVLDEIAELEDERFLPKPVQEQARARWVEPVLAETRRVLQAWLARLPGLLVELAHRCVPLRGKRWVWRPLLDKEGAPTGCHELAREDAPGPKPWVRGQRGLSMERIEQIEKLRQRIQALNQTLRRPIGGPPPLSSRAEGGEVPDPCPDLLEKLDNLKQQRVYQTAHLILAEALGVRLAAPPENKAELLLTRDQHGAYEKTLTKDGSWRGAVDFIVIENLSRYRASQGRAPRENGRLMKWCHRAIRDKLREMCEVFGIPVLETPAAWSSRFCSRSGVAGFRAVEVAPGFETQWPWCRRRGEDDTQPLSEEAREIRAIEAQAQAARDIPTKHGGKPSAPRTLLIPQAGGPIFVPAVERAPGADLQPALAQADINAALNLGLRAIADPRVWAIHPRLRSERGAKEGILLAREKRKFGEKAKKRIVLSKPPAGSENEDGGHQPNFFADLGGCAAWGHATLEGEDVPLVVGVALWTAVKQRQWERCRRINEDRLRKWRAAADDVNM